MSELMEFAELDKCVNGVIQCTFSSGHDGSVQAYLIRDYRQSHSQRETTIVLYLHGSGAHQEQGMTREIYNGAFERWAEEFARLGVIHICPEYRGSSWMGPAAEDDVRQIIESVVGHVGPAKVILFGASMGGTSALIFAMRNPRLVDGVIALCPASDPAEVYASFSAEMSSSYGGSPDENRGEYVARRTRDQLASLAAKRIAIVHGSADAVIPVAHSRKLVEGLEAVSSKLKYLEIEDGDHDSPLQVSPRELLAFVLEGDKE